MLMALSKMACCLRSSCDGAVHRTASDPLPHVRCFALFPFLQLACRWSRVAITWCAHDRDGAIGHKPALDQADSQDRRSGGGDQGVPQLQRGRSYLKALLQQGTCAGVHAVRRCMGLLRSQPPCLPMLRARGMCDQTWSYCMAWHQRHLHLAESRASQL